MRVRVPDPFLFCLVRVVLEYSVFSAKTVGLQYSRLFSVNFGDYEFVAFHDFHDGSIYCLTSGVGFVFFAYVSVRELV